MVALGALGTSAASFHCQLWTCRDSSQHPSTPYLRTCPYRLNALSDLKSIIALHRSKNTKVRRLHRCQLTPSCSKHRVPLHTTPQRYKWTMAKDHLYSVRIQLSMMPTTLCQTVHLATLTNLSPSKSQQPCFPSPHSVFSIPLSAQSYL
jgi:hypothetical protein